MNQRPGTDLAPVHVWLAPSGRDQRPAAHELLLDLAESLLGTRPVLRHDELGRPHLPGLWVSISHAPELIAVAAGQDGPVGVDVENQHAREVASMARRWFTPAELDWMTGQPDELQAFLHLWTAKEAVGKALGQGLRNAGLHRQMPLPAPTDRSAVGGSGVRESEVARSASSADARQGAPLLGGVVPSVRELAVVHLPVAAGAVVAVALPVGTRLIEVCEHHGAALRRTVVSRTSFPVVVRGN